MKQLLQTIATPSFIEKTLLLLATAALSGFLIPIVTQEIASRNYEQQKRFDAELTRQGEIIQAQVGLLEKLSDLVWEYQLLVIDVSYYQSFENEDYYVAAVSKFNENSGPLLGKIRAEISKALRLTSFETYEDLKALYYDNLINNIDAQLGYLIAIGGTKDEWSNFNLYAVYGLSDEVDNVLSSLAIEIQLSSDRSGRKD